MGVYKGWKFFEEPSDATTKRVIYHHEFHMKKGEDSYEDVALPLPKPDAQLFT